jgi:hypothetical protein
MLRCPHVLVNAVCLTIALSACAAGENNPHTSSVHSPQAALSSSVATPVPVDAVNPWVSVLNTPLAPSGWDVRPCAGTAPFLCVEENQAFIGSVELATWKIETLPDFQKMLEKAGIEQNSGNSESSLSSEQVLSALRIWVADHYTHIKADRQSTPNIIVLTQAPVEMPIGGLWGLRYEFVESDRASGEVQKRALGYVAFDGQQLYVISTAVDIQAEAGTIRSEAELQRFEPYLTEMVTNLKLQPSDRPMLSFNY